MTHTASIRTIVRASILLASVSVIGVIGYRILGGPDTDWLDAAYMTVITLTTVGYEEAIDLTNSPAGKAFTIGLLLTGVSTFVYFFSHLTAFVVDGSLDRLLWRRRMNKAIAEMQDHIIVCGAGHTGRHIVKELVDTDRPFVVIEQDEALLRELEEKHGKPVASVEGDARDDETLEQAGIERAAALIACVSGDKDNLIVTVSARLLNPALRIVSRCHDENVGPKIRKAGADAVVSPEFIGGLRIVSETVRPRVVTFLDKMLRDQDRRLRVEGVPLGPASPLIGTTVGQLRERQIPELLVVALSRPDQSWTYNPRDEHPLEAGTEIIFMGNPDARLRLEDAARSAPPASEAGGN
ncbi:MAG: potassium channel protein [bacterium]|nr:potassium channel protein [bacterium]